MAVPASDIRAGAAHVEAERWGQSGAVRHARGADHPPGRSAQEGVLAAEPVACDEAARAGHVADVRPRHLRGQAFAVFAQDGGQVRVEHRGIPPVDKFR